MTVTNAFGMTGSDSLSVTQAPSGVAVLVGAGVPLFEIPGRGGPASLVALLVSGIGAAIGYAVARVAESG